MWAMKGWMVFGGGGLTNGVNGLTGRAATERGTTSQKEEKTSWGKGIGFTGEAGFWALEVENEDGVEYWVW